MNSLKLDIIESYFLVTTIIILGFFLFYPNNSVKIGNSALSTRIFTNIVVGGDIIWPEITVLEPTVTQPTMPLPVPSATPAPLATPFPDSTPTITNSTTNFSTNIPVVNTNK